MALPGQPGRRRALPSSRQTARGRHRGLLPPRRDPRTPPVPAPARRDPPASPIAAWSSRSQPPITVETPPESRPPVTAPPPAPVQPPVTGGIAPHPPPVPAAPGGTAPCPNKTGFIRGRAAAAGRAAGAPRGTGPLPGEPSGLRDGGDGGRAPRARSPPRRGLLGPLPHLPPPALQPTGEGGGARAPGPAPGSGRGSTGGRRPRGSPTYPLPRFLRHGGRGESPRSWRYRAGAGPRRCRGGRAEQSLAASD